MADKTIRELPRAARLDNDSLMIAEQQGEAVSVTGELIASFARDAAEADVQKAVDAAASAESAANRAELAKESITIDEEKLAQAVSRTSESATSAKTSADNAAQSAEDAEESANRAQAEAERVTVPAAAGVYNMILTDRVTDERYALIVENGRLAILGVSETLEATDMNLIDSATGTAYAVVVDSGTLILEEV